MGNYERQAEMFCPSNFLILNCNFAFCTLHFEFQCYEVTRITPVVHALNDDN